MFTLMGIKVIGIVPAAAAHSKINRQKIVWFEQGGTQMQVLRESGVVMINDIIISLLVAFPLLCTIYLFRLLTNKLQVSHLLHTFC